MKFVAATFGQALQLIPMDEVRPASGYDYPSVIRAVIERYSFSEFPTNLKEALEKGASFSNGTMTSNRNPIQITTLGIYNDGILVSTLNTDDADLIIDDFLRWGTDEFGLRPIQTQIGRTYSSQIVVDFEASIDRFVKDVDSVIKLVRGAIHKSTGVDFDLHVSRLAISADPLSVRFPAQSTFYIEPRAGRPFSSNRYLSGAPVTTSTHRELLVSIEKLLT